MIYVILCVIFGCIGSSLPQVLSLVGVSGSTVWFWPRRLLSAAASLVRSTGFKHVGFRSRGSQAAEHRLRRGDAQT